MYEGHTGMESGRILGRENVGEVIAVGKAELLRVPCGDYDCQGHPQAGK